VKDDTDPERPVTTAVKRLVAAGMASKGGIRALGDFWLVLDEAPFAALSREQSRPGDAVVVLTAQGRTVVTCKGVT
jgi:hypothetical protein